MLNKLLYILLSKTKCFPQPWINQSPKNNLKIIAFLFAYELERLYL